MGKKGFTLIELMIVIAIIGFLTAIALPSFTNITKDAEIAQIQGNETNLQTALNMYVADTGNSVASLFGRDTGPGHITDGLDEFSDEWEEVMDKEFEQFYKYFSKDKLPTLPGSKRWRALYVNESSLHHDNDPLFDSSTFVNDEHHYGWLFTNKGNVYPIVREGKYGKRYDEFI